MRRSQSLDGPWRYTPMARVTMGGDGEWQRDTSYLPPAGEMPVPAHWERAGLQGFAGTVRFEREFISPSLESDESLWLICRGVDYFATVYVNDEFAGSHEGYFQTWELDITPYLRDGENALAIEVTCPREEPGAVWPHNKRLIKGILSHWDCRPGSWDPDTGQDIHSGGIWNGVLLEVRPAIRIGGVKIQTWLTPSNDALSQEFTSAHGPVPTERVARVLVTTEIVSASQIGRAALRLDIQVGEHTVRTDVSSLPMLRATVESVLTIPEPKLWWTWDHGDPYLYPCSISLYRDDQLVDRHEQMVGIRDVSIDPQTGAWTLNGRRIFVRGTNIVPTLWLGEYDEQMIDTDITLLKEAHINAVRVCVHVNREEFYGALDRAGILVWQDFALQWTYQQSDAFVAEAIQQVRDMVRQLYHHPCIALWCCQNESTQFNRLVLDPLLEHAAVGEDSSRYVRPTSEFAEHLYYGWYWGEMRDYLREPQIGIVSEFGAQALPSPDEMRAMIGPGWPPDWTQMAYHDFQYDQTFHVARIAMGESWEEFVSSSQRYQAELLKLAIERFRRARYTPVGCLFQFMFVDCWPSITWSVISYDRRPKAGYTALKHAYQPVLVGATLLRDTWLLRTDPSGLTIPAAIDVWVVNDRPVEYADAQIIISLSSGEPISGREELATVACTIPPDSVTTFPSTRLALPDGLSGGNHTLELRLIWSGEALSANEYPVRLVTQFPA